MCFHDLSIYKVDTLHKEALVLKLNLDCVEFGGADVFDGVERFGHMGGVAIFKGDIFSFAFLICETQRATLEDIGDISRMAVHSGFLPGLHMNIEHPKLLVLIDEFMDIRGDGGLRYFG